jgi:ADP-dependent phosphofructokinase/glucokinase
MEYQKNVDWGEHSSPRANRFIAHCDATNAELKPMPEFHTALESFKPEAVVLAGLHLLERGSEEFQDQVRTFEFSAL